MAGANAQLDSFIAKFDPKDQKLIRAVRAALRKRLPAANELVWDNYNFFVIGYSPTDRPSDAILSIAARAGNIGVCFIHGATLPDPTKILQGSGKQTRFIRLESARTLAQPAVEALIKAAIARAKVPLPATLAKAEHAGAKSAGKLIIRSIAKKQRPRRKAGK